MDIRSDYLADPTFNEVEWLNQLLQEKNQEKHQNIIQEQEMNLRITKRQLEDALVRDFNYIQQNEQSIKEKIQKLAIESENTQSLMKEQLIDQIQEIEDLQID